MKLMATFAINHNNQQYNNNGVNNIFDRSIYKNNNI